MNIKHCVNCACQNEEHFTYCKYCGALLPVVDRQSVCPDGTDVFDASQENVCINRHEYKRYVGKNSESIVSAFEEMQAAGKKTSFCSPVFFLGVFFGSYGISAWFLSRKLKFQGTIFLLLGVALTFADAFLNIGLNRDLYSNLVLALSGDAAALSNIGYSLLSYSNSLTSVSVYVSLVFSFICGFFALHIYKNKVTKDILELKARYTEETRLPLDILLKRAGGRQDAAVLIPLGVSLIANLLSFAVTVI